jgi:hypothetical protein
MYDEQFRQNLFLNNSFVRHAVPSNSQETVDNPEIFRLIPLAIAKGWPARVTHYSVRMFYLDVR